VTTHRTEIKQPPAFLDGSASTASPPGPPSVLPPPVQAAAAKRRVNRRGALVAVLAVLLGGLISFSAAKLMTKHTEVLAVAKLVPAGTVISDADLTTAQITTDPHLSPILVADRSQVVGKIATVALSPGEMLTRTQIGTSDGFTSGQLLVALALKPGQFPIRGLAPGQHVLIIATPGTNGTSAAPGNDSTAGSGIAAVVAEVGSRDVTTQVTVADVRVASADGVSAAQLASTGNLAIILLPAGG
jgi:SAF domain